MSMTLGPRVPGMTVMSTCLLSTVRVPDVKLMGVTLSSRSALAEGGCEVRSTICPRAAPGQPVDGRCRLRNGSTPCLQARQKVRTATATDQTDAACTAHVKLRAGR